MRKILLLTLPLFFLLSNCEEENPVAPVGTIPVLSQLLAPDTLYLVSEVNHFISVHVDDPQGITDIAMVTCTILSSGSGDAVKTDSLVDDGTQGDIIPIDGTYTTSIDADFAQEQAGDYYLVFKAIDLSGNESDTLSHKLVVVEGEENIAPSITDLILPSAFDIKETNNYYLITAKVNDTQGQDNIELVLLQIFAPTNEIPVATDSLLDDGNNEDAVAGDSIYSKSINSTFAGNNIGKFSFHFQAFDLSGGASNAVVKVVDVTRSDNDPPTIFDLVAPDTMYLVADNDVLDTLRINATDPQELTDIREVYFYSYLPDGTEAKNSPTSMADDGNIQGSGDRVADDGIFSVIIRLPYGTQQGNYTFIFEAVDKSDFKSNQIHHILTVTE